MCLDLVFYKIIDGSKLELIRSFSINFLRDYYGELVNIILKNSTMHNPSESEVYICPSTNFIIIYDQFDKFCKNVYVDIDVEDKKINLIRAINSDMYKDDLEVMFEDFINIREDIYANKSYIDKIKDIMLIFKEYSNKNAYCYLSY